MGACRYDDSDESNCEESGEIVAFEDLLCELSYVL